jgi:5-formaminoimidazole-4-carboxamide-1-beta-D-ribofuranosyl 5'-monophosphate synthetase
LFWFICWLIGGQSYGWKLRQQGACLGDNVALELRVAHERGALHRMAAFVVVDADLT